MFVNITLILVIGQLLDFTNSIRAFVLSLQLCRVGLKSDGTTDDGTDDGTLNRPRICKPLYGPSQGDETGD